MSANAIKILLMLLTVLTLTNCSHKPEVRVEVKYVPKIVEKTVVVKCKIDTPLCSKLKGPLDEQLFSSVKCIADLRMYITICNQEKQ